MMSFHTQTTKEDTKSISSMKKTRESTMQISRMIRSLDFYAGDVDSVERSLLGDQFCSHRRSELL